MLSNVMNVSAIRIYTTNDILTFKIVRAFRASTIRSTARKYNYDENLENYDSEVQLFARAHSGPRLGNKNHLRLSARTKLRSEFRVRKVQNILHAVFCLFILLISNHTVFLVQFGIPNEKNRMITDTN